MNSNQAVFIFLCSLLISIIETKQRRPLLSADEIPTMKPTCTSISGAPKSVPCPTPDSNDITNWPCVRYTDLCNGVQDCPNGEDENLGSCFMHNVRSNQIRKLARELDQIRG